MSILKNKNTANLMNDAYVNDSTHVTLLFFFLNINYSQSLIYV